MNNRDIEDRLKKAVENSVPDVREAILSRCDEKGTVIEMKSMDMRKSSGKSSGWKKYAAVAAVAMLMLGGGGVYMQGNAVDSIIALDVNPSIELSVNKKERVVSAEALNDDAKIVLEDMDLKGTDLDVAVNALIGSMVKNGYLSELQNSILISVENSDTARGKALEEKLVAEVNELLEASAIEGAILSQQVKADDKAAEQTAREYKISEGKAALIEKIAGQNELLKKEDLKELSINELNLLADSKKMEIKDTNSTGKASDKNYIGAEKAKAAALKAAGVKEADAGAMEIELDVERGVMTYEVEFKSNGTEYDYEIDALTGDVLRAEKDVDDDWRDDDDDDRPMNQQTSAGGNSGQQTGSQTNSGTAAGDKIGEAKAKSIALNHAGLKEADVRELKAELDYEDDHGRWEYEVEFKSGTVEYDYEIDAVSGAILKAEKEIDD